MKLLKKGFAMAIAAAMLLSSTMTAFAAEERTKITSVKLTITADLEDSSDFDDMTLDVTSDGGNYYVDDYKVTSTSSSTYPTIQVTLNADDGYYFDVSSSDIKLSGDKASLSSKSTKSKSEILTLKIKLTDITADLDEVATQNSVPTESPHGKASAAHRNTNCASTEAAAALVPSYRPQIRNITSAH
ncbi:hypothetical protein [Clostridium sp. AM58-1XD]|uniref:hypothetical protein n=1 Tax=Clostridium sp. AM58-1XD TaxID=2292307 RepID=UPI000E472746|nr:hypothetical protein [Clostridium sp. AM58-1XD]RGY96932.1 hypothetical protein DXA13_15980 [Clostridium sp. AM58-1XD]